MQTAVLYSCVLNCRIILTFAANMMLMMHRYLIVKEYVSSVDVTGRACSCDNVFTCFMFRRWRPRTGSIIRW